MDIRTVGGGGWLPPPAITPQPLLENLWHGRSDLTTLPTFWWTRSPKVCIFGVPKILTLDMRQPC